MSFWSLPLAESCVHFVGSTLSPQLEQLLVALEQASVIGIDAEWKPVRAAGQQPKVSILQLACRIVDGDRVFLVDMLMPGAHVLVEPLARALQSCHILKLGFRLRQDLIHLAASFGAALAKVQPYLDVGKLYRRTMRGAAHDAGLSSICEAVLGLPLCKDMQCSNWEDRPLTPSQQAYAAADAYCLVAICDALRDDLLKDKAVGMSQLLYPLHCASTSILTRFKTMVAQSEPDYLRFLGETLSVDHEQCKNKNRSRKPRIRNRQSFDDDNLNWQGPAPWDPALGGDGSPKFLCDIMIEGLARHLRCVGVNAACPHGLKLDARQLVEQAVREGRVLLTRDMKLLRQRLVPCNYSYRVKSLTKREQLTEIINTFKLTISEDQLLSRCTKCNGDLFAEPLTAQQAKAAAAPKQEIPAEIMSQEGLLFWQCSECKHLYWQGLQFRNALQQFTLMCCGESATRLHLFVHSEAAL